MGLLLSRPAVLKGAMLYDSAVTFPPIFLRHDPVGRTPAKTEPISPLNYILKELYSWRAWKWSPCPFFGIPFHVLKLASLEFY
ncbi:hypothetical protein KC19_VG187800 [Ceratodon purpureus]|uniref:Uncharacterized protein n=1 Tax=Ceratodon purpureus TaxID=3225 RepID=A0A8T0HSM4_CERPU|nr:hypothetical protein KC19_VG187800 [Ceratodon purpureus]